MPATTNKLLTLADLENIPGRDGFRYELRNGELVPVPPPIHRHKRLQLRLMELLKITAGSAGVVSPEQAYAIDEHNYRIADLVFIPMARWNAIDDFGQFRGAPDVSIEIVSPSNTATEMNEKRKLCLENGSKEFWLVDPDVRTVEVSTPDGRSITYKSGQRIPLFFAPESPLAVDAIFDI